MRVDVRPSLGEADLDFQIRELLDDRRNIHPQAIVIAHRPSVRTTICIAMMFLICSLVMTVKAFDADTPLEERRIIIRRSGGDVEMVELPWGLRPRERGGRPFTVIRVEGRTFPSHRCLVSASEFRFRSHGKHYSFALADGDWFYFSGIWRPVTRDWPESHAILTTEANADVAPFHDRQMAVLRRGDRMRWLDYGDEENNLLKPLPAGMFKVRHLEASLRESC